MSTLDIPPNALEPIVSIDVGISIDLIEVQP